uniref:uncharacterized protein LOC117600695 n=1 Tax=Osmia lignaria TaxID=473952 RepID=UPI0014797E83|nr:uncharacterized protein LOC117600695 [Osmia lignaria]
MLSPNQYGFRQHRSTTDVLLNLETSICEAFLKNEFLITVCLDIEKAYDSIPRTTINNALTKTGLNGNILAFIKNFLTNRTIQVRTNGTLSKPTIIHNGVPQGSVISVTLFLIVINDVLNNIKPPIQGTLFADDLTITCSGKSLITIIELLQESINDLLSWSEKSGLKFSPLKTKYIIFSRKRKRTILPPKLYIRNTEIEKVNSIRILGLIFDHKLTWGPHMKYLKTTCSKKMNIIKALANNSWGADQEIIIQTYQALIRSKLDYGSIVYSAKPNTLKTIDSIHNAALRIATGSYRTSPINSILFESKKPSLEQRRKYLSLKYAAKMSSIPINPTYNNIFTNRYTHLQAKKPKSPNPFYGRIAKYDSFTVITSTPTIPRKYRKTAPWTLKIPETNVDLAKLPKNQTSSIEHRLNFQQLCNKYPNHQTIYTDASKTDQAVGAAIVTNNTTKKFHLPAASSIFTAEAWAVLEALNYIRNNNLQSSIIITDSMSVTMAIANINCETKHEVILNIQYTYTDLINNGKQISLVWVLSHQGIKGNEAADTAAKEATALPPDDNRRQVPYQDLIVTLRHIEQQAWNKIWITSKKIKTHDVTKDFYQTMPSSNMKRKDRIVMARLRTGHCRLTHDYLIKKTEPPMCITCKKNITTNHLLFECRRHNTQRQKYGITSTEVLTTQKLVENTLNFLKDINIYHSI